MHEKPTPLLLTRLLWPLVLAVLSVAALLAYHTGDPHWLNRGGATIAALAAGFVVLQIMAEIGIEKERHSLEVDKTRAEKKEEPVMPLHKKERDINEKRRQNKSKDLDRQRLGIVLSIALCAMLGELLHGFGDLAACALLLDCAVHA